MTTEEIMAAFFRLLETAAPFKKTGRRIILWGQVDSSEKPALFVTEHAEDWNSPDDSTPGKNTIEGKIWIYTDAGNDPTIAPITILNKLIADVQKALRPNVFGFLALDGMQARVYLNGKVLKDPGDLDGNGVAVLPFQILLPST